ncbi:MAG: bifunctional dihydroorotate dehydrogenase B NAD binding subunit/NADPH-dependent glutamate synthase [Leptotrichiaceae bacterium]|nr:bifunctional dihydroorotate dehydrogenase B NAD binding subunit/NADPH-dependent glutamate synthase [Leptotrichiaceae bacterium]MBP6281151.1 bifunctional dihydroorotate dehydrogenase B NAD binding subunit/NADPH-dependent glutamate synthase [Leptotrichiaceae bacterium]MBP7100931.1 bifunctional dihydroorotate dehydrogenase B NAD binding subunit/NADPH-dependent glutamate synthase [Leptotrichiaceae bacterium]MBP7739486.1 bifunctional dihydroorotate dehydrogenase B NAD binding subunit/NADPH-depende
MFKIVEKKKLTPNIYLMRVYAPRVAESSNPGQFVIVITDQMGERIPLTIADYDREEGTVTVVIQAIGSSTKEVCKLEEGDSFLNFVGPLGKPSELIYETTEELKMKKILFVAGGLGAAPVYPQVKYLHSRGIDVDVIMGAKTKEAIIYEEDMKKIAKNVYIVTDDGSYGRQGLVTNELERLIEEEKKEYDLVIAIGPMIMMKFTVLKTKEYNIKTIVSLNPIMVDGTGMCGACRLTVNGSVKFACVDGPEFVAEEINFDEALRRQAMYKTVEEKGKINKKKDDKSIDVCEMDKLDKKDSFDRKKKVKDIVQPAEDRINNFEEVSKGYTAEMAMLEATRCLNCKKPLCVPSCPVNVHIPEFIMEVKEGNFEKAAKIIKETNSLPAVCGRVCPQESQCEGSCIVGFKNEPVAIGRLERFVADYAREKGIKFQTHIQKNNKKIAIIGSGPSGIACAGDLAKMGYDVTIFEALHEPGGVLVYGIPEFRLPKKEVVEYEIKEIIDLGVKIETDVLVGKTVMIDDLIEKENYEAVYIASGAGLPNFMNIKGENSNGVFSANELLTRSNLMKAFDENYKTPIKLGKRVAVVGAGNVAMDAARTARRLGSEVYLVYRRSEEESPARMEELEHAKEEGINFMFLTNPVEIISDENGWVKAMKCIKMELGEPDASGRRSPIPIQGSEFDLEVETVVMSIGTSPNPLISQTTPGLEINKWKCVVANEETGKTTKDKVFAGGDAVTGAATVILAMGAGKKAANAINEMIKFKN